MKALLVHFYRRDKQVFVVGSLLIYLIGDDDLVFGFLDLYQFAELCGFAGFAFADDLGLRFKGTDQFVFCLGIAIEEASLGVTNHLLHATYKRMQFSSDAL